MNSHPEADVWQNEWAENEGYKEILGKIHGKLVEWFSENARDLPWRENYSEYEIWISEIMLQQTQVETVLRYFNRWMGVLPTVESLNEADLASVYKLWEGLGYYNRCRNIKKTASVLIKKYQGRLPKNLRELMNLPGIGPYTAGAIRNIAFEIPTSMVDGNVFRVLARILDWDKNQQDRLTQRFFDQSTLFLTQCGKPRIVAQALMELGALVCRKANPDCNTCPVSGDCLALVRERVQLRPVVVKKEKVEPLTLHHFLIRKHNRILLKKPTQEGWWSGLWCFPWCTEKDRESFEKKLGIESVQILKGFSHRVTKYKIASRVHDCGGSEQADVFGKDDGNVLRQEYADVPGEEYAYVVETELNGLSMSLPSIKIRKFLESKRKSGKKK